MQLAFPFRAAIQTGVAPVCKRRRERSQLWLGARTNHAKTGNAQNDETRMRSRVGSNGDLNVGTPELTCIGWFTSAPSDASKVMQPTCT